MLSPVETVARARNVAGHVIERIRLSLKALRRACIDEKHRWIAEMRQRFVNSQTHLLAKPRRERRGRTRFLAAADRTRPRVTTWRNRRRARRRRRGRRSEASTRDGSRTGLHPGRRRSPAVLSPMPTWENVAAMASGDGNGWRPLVPVLGPERSCARFTKTAPGMWAARYCARPHCSSLRL